MKKILSIFALLIFAALFSSTALADDLPVISGRGHLSDIGWVDSSEGTNHILVGTVGQSRRIEAVALNIDYPDLGISYQAHVQDIGWMDPVQNPGNAGTEGQGKKIEAMIFSLTGPNAANFNLYARAHVENYGWLDWAPSGQATGTSNHNYRCEAFEIVIYPKDAGAPGDTRMPYIMASTRAESGLVHAVNKLRASHGLKYLSGSATLKAVADLRVNEYATNLSHTRPNGTSFRTAVRDRFPNYPYDGVGIDEIGIEGRLSYLNPVSCYECTLCYPHEVDKYLNPEARWICFSGTQRGSMAYTIQLISGADTIDFDRY